MYIIIFFRHNGSERKTMKQNILKFCVTSWTSTSNLNLRVHLCRFIGLRWLVSPWEYLPVSGALSGAPREPPGVLMKTQLTTSVFGVPRPFLHKFYTGLRVSWARTFVSLIFETVRDFIHLFRANNSTVLVPRGEAKKPKMCGVYILGSF